MGERAALAAAARHPEPNDVDGDEVPNADDNCPTVRNGSQLDTDGDTSDNCRVVADPDQEPDPDHPGFGLACPPVDDDGDGIINEDDNCDLAANPGQADLDGDDKGDDCDTDRDGDRFDDRYDNCPTVYDIEPPDTTGDGYINDQRDGDGITATPPPVIHAPPPVIQPPPPRTAIDRASPRPRLRVKRRDRMAEIRAASWCD